MSSNGIELPDFSFNAASILLFLVRHGQTTWNVERRFQGQLDVLLSPVGVGQAKELAEWLSGLSVRFSAVYSSDLSRAADTAKVIASKIGTTPIFHPALRELDAGEWQGLTTAEVEERYPGQLKAWRENVAHFTLPGGESVPDVQRRFSQYISNVVQAHIGEAIVVVSHGAALSSYIAEINGWDLQETWDSRRARMSNTGVTALILDAAGSPRTLIVNSTLHLAKSPHLPSVIDPEPAVDKDESHAEFAV